MEKIIGLLDLTTEQEHWKIKDNWKKISWMVSKENNCYPRTVYISFKNKYAPQIFKQNRIEWIYSQERASVEAQW